MIVRCSSCGVETDSVRYWRLLDVFGDRWLCEQCKAAQDRAATALAKDKIAAARSDQ